MFSLHKAKATDTLRNGSSWLWTYGFWSWHPMSCSSIVHAFDARSHRHSTSAGRSVLKYFPEAQSLRCLDHLRASHLRKKGAYINPLGYAVGSVGILLDSPSGFPSVPTSNTRRSWPNMVASETFPSGKCIATYETLWRVFCSLFLIASITDHTSHQTRVDTCGHCLELPLQPPWTGHWKIALGQPIRCHAIFSATKDMLDGRVRSIRMPAEDNQFLAPLLFEKKWILQHVSAHASVNVQDARGPCWARYLAQLLGPSVLLRLVGGMLLNTAWWHWNRGHGHRISYWQEFSWNFYILTLHAESTRAVRRIFSQNLSRNKFSQTCIQWMSSRTISLKFSQWGFFGTRRSCSCNWIATCVLCQVHCSVKARVRTCGQAS